MPSYPSFDEELLGLYPALVRFSKSLCREPSDAEDLVHDTVAKALKYRESYLPYGSLKSWLFTIMKNTFCTRFKKAKRETGPLDWEPAAVQPAQDSAMELQDVGKAFARLSPDFRATVKFVIFDGLPYDEAAKRMNCSVGTVKSRLHRARTQLNDAHSPVHRN
ncbi:RNA polymerase sigma factor [Brucella anthropi]|uniref:RNA polymerase sigma factor n=1 Tax=Brucella anthropi TaxID=529 RepID=UPI00174719FF|nr:RNA polymerase sigma factor [Ochrobactrum sp. MT180101]